MLISFHARPMSRTSIINGRGRRTIDIFALKAQLHGSGNCSNLNYVMLSCWNLIFGKTLRAMHTILYYTILYYTIGLG